MKTMTCAQLGGSCQEKFDAETFEEMTEMAKRHGAAMFMAGDKPHLEAIQKMQQLMQTPDAMAKWFEEKKKVFASL